MKLLKYIFFLKFESAVGGAMGSCGPSRRVIMPSPRISAPSSGAAGATGRAEERDLQNKRMKLKKKIV